MTTPFPGFQFYATGTPSGSPATGTKRTLPDRIAEIKNVRDFGAVGNGVADDWAAIMAAYNWAQITMHAAASNLQATFTGVIASSPTFTGSISGSTLTASGVTGTLAVGQTVFWSGGSDIIASFGSGSGGAGTYNLSNSHGTVGSQNMQTNTVLTASAVSGTIGVNDVINDHNVNIPNATGISSQVSGTTGGAGVYVLGNFFGTSLGSLNVSSEAMYDVNNVLVFTSAVPSQVNNQGQWFAYNQTQPNTLYQAQIQAVSGNQVTALRALDIVNIGDVILLNTYNKGIVYFPPGTYYVSKPILGSVIPFGDNSTLTWLGSLGASIITGNFADYIFSRVNGFSNLIVFDGLTIINQNALGGGIRFGGNNVCGAIRNCNIIANRGINTSNEDTSAPFAGSLELSIESCIFAGVGSDSSGILSVADGPITNCRFIGLTKGIQFSAGGGEGATCAIGNYFEKCTSGVICETPDDQPNGDFQCSLLGNWFKNCATAIDVSKGSIGRWAVLGNRIEGANGQAPGGNPQYGMLLGGSGSGDLTTDSHFAGILITGQYDQVGVAIFGQTFQFETSLDAVGSYNTGSGVATPSWQFNNNSGSWPYFPYLAACNTRQIRTVSLLPSGGDSGWVELDVSDGTNSIGWGNPVTNTGTHTTHYCGRWNGSNWTVVGQ